MRKLGVRKGDTKDDLFILPQHPEQNLSEEETAERIADYFTAISQEFEPLIVKNLPPNILKCIDDAKTDSDIPILEPYEVYRKIKRAENPNSVIPGDIPKHVIQLFSPELAEPVSIIYKRFSLSFQYPRQWVKVSQIAVPKVFHPKSEDDLRPLSRTFFLNKVYDCWMAPSWHSPLHGSWSKWNERVLYSPLPN